VASTWTVTVLILGFVSSRFISLKVGLRGGEAHMSIVVVVVIGGGRIVMSVSVAVTVSTSYKVIVDLMYCVQKALALY
jgi:hypothetical protein